MATIYTTGSTYSTADYWSSSSHWMELYKKKFENQLQKEELAKKIAKPKLMEFNIKAKGWKPAAEKKYFGALDKTYYKQKFPVLPATIVGHDGVTYLVDEDEKGMYWIPA